MSLFDRIIEKLWSRGYKAIQRKYLKQQLLENKET
jgi:hypothetical protein